MRLICATVQSSSFSHAGIFAVLFIFPIPVPDTLSGKLVHGVSKEIIRFSPKPLNDTFITAKVIEIQEA